MSNLQKMKQCDSLMKEILENEWADADDFTQALRDSPQKLESLNLLEAKGYVKTRRAWGGDILTVSVLDAGKTYFLDRASQKREKWIDRAIGFVAGVLTTVIGQLIVRWIAALPG